jgi:spermidine synthase
MARAKAATADAPLGRGLRLYLYAAAAIAGAAIMVIEILGAKMLAPYFGTSHFVWTAQIAVTLVALAAGYYAGGKLADRGPRLGRLFAGILAAALALALSALTVRPIAEACLSFSLPVGSLLAAVCLFFLPLGLLAMCGPFLIRVLTEEVGAVGGNAGRLGAISTVGSFAGTVLVGYVLVPRVGNLRVMEVLALALGAVAALYFALWGRRRGGAPLAALLALAAGLAGERAVGAEARAGFGDMRELYRGNSPFGELQVVETEDGRRFYVNDYLIQNGYDSHSKQSTSVFTYVLEGLARGYTRRLERALCLGLGVGVVPRRLAAAGAQVDVVEINAGAPPVARRYFDFDPPPGRLNLVIDDARHFVHRARPGYDAVVLDTFLGDSSPAHLLTRETFAEIARLLAPGGVLVINSFGNTGPGGGVLSASLTATLKAVFPSVRVHHIGTGNVFFVAAPSPLPPLEQRLDVADIHPEPMIWVMRFLERGEEPRFEGGFVLTDDFNPIDYHDAHDRETTRRQLLAAARRR